MRAGGEFINDLLSKMFCGNLIWSFGKCREVNGMNNNLKQAAVISGDTAPFPKEEFENRQNALRRLLLERNIDLLMVTGPENIFYLTGQQTPGYYTFQCLGIPVEGEPFMLLRELESYNAIANTYLSDIETYGDDMDPGETLSSILREKGWVGKRIAMDRSSWFLTVSLYSRLTDALGEMSDGSGLVEAQRVIKTPLEIEAMETAARYNDDGMQAGIEAVKAGVTENQIAAKMMAAAIEAGSEYMAMDPFVTTGPRSGIPHTTWRRRKLEVGDAVLLENSACHNRYHAALMRTVWVGKAPQKAKDMMSACEEGLAAAIDEIRPGRTCAAVHHACQSVIDKYGFTEHFRKRTGYGIGISFSPDWGEGHIISLYHNVKRELEPGMAFHMPPALRDYGKFAVGVSETVIVTDTGCRTLSTIPRAMVEI